MRRRQRLHARFSVLALALGCGDVRGGDAEPTTAPGDETGDEGADDDDADDDDAAGTGDGGDTGSPATGGADDGDGDATDAGATGSGTATDDATGSDDAGSGDTDDPPVECPTGQLDAALPIVLEAETVRGVSGFASACGGGFAPEATYVFTAPRTGSYTFDTLAGCPVSDELGPNYNVPVCPWDTVLYVLDGACEGEAIVCSDDDFGTASVVGVELEAGATVTVVVDGIAASGGPFTLRATEQRVTCPIADLGATLPVTVDGQTAIAQNGHDPTCFGNGNRPDAMFTFTAPHTGSFAFDTPGTAFSTMVFVLDGSCEGDEIACSYDLPLQVELTAGQTVTVGVEGMSAAAVGDLQLRAQAL